MIGIFFLYALVVILDTPLGEKDSAMVSELTSGIASRLQLKENCNKIFFDEMLIECQVGLLVSQKYIEAFKDPCKMTESSADQIRITAKALKGYWKEFSTSAEGNALIQGHTLKVQNVFLKSQLLLLSKFTRLIENENFVRGFKKVFEKNISDSLVDDLMDLSLNLHNFKLKPYDIVTMLREINFTVPDSVCQPIFYQVRDLMLQIVSLQNPEVFDSQDFENKVNFPTVVEKIKEFNCWTSISHIFFGPMVNGITEEVEYNIIHTLLSIAITLPDTMSEIYEVIESCLEKSDFACGQMMGQKLNFFGPVVLELMVTMDEQINDMIRDYLKL